MSPLRLLLFRTFATGLVLTTSTQVFVRLYDSYWQTQWVPVEFDYPSLPAWWVLYIAGAIVGAVVVLSASALALALVWRAPHRAEARALALFLALIAFATSTGGSGVFLGYIKGSGPEYNTFAGLGRVGVHTVLHASFIFALAALVRFSFLFPRPLTAENLRRASGAEGTARRVWFQWMARRVLQRRGASKLAARVRSIASREIRFFDGLHEKLLSPRVLWSSAAIASVITVVIARLFAEMRMSLPGGRWILLGDIGLNIGEIFRTLLKTLYAILILGGIFLAVRNLRIGYVISTDAERRRIFWVVEGFLLSAVVVVIFSTLGFLGWATDLTVDPFDLGYPLGILRLFGAYLSHLILLACLAIALFYKGAMDPAVVIRGTAVYGALGVTLVFLFGGVESLMSNLVAKGLGLPEALAPLIGGGAVAVAFGPVRERLRKIAKRLFAGRGSSGERVGATPTGAS